MLSGKTGNLIKVRGRKKERRTTGFSVVYIVYFCEHLNNKKKGGKRFQGGRQNQTSVAAVKN